MKRPLLLALSLGIATSVLTGIANTYLPYSEIKIRITDALTIPGALIAGLAYPEGVHTGHGAPMFGFWAMVANLGIYILFWYVVLRLIGYFRHRGHRADAVPEPKPTA